ncbi:hypothetical protein AGMMS50276_09300 [Synergistales bacterium]|nr:hypothetical protein AGMMS50276_09300 [Synergistales bacterium]
MSEKALRVSDKELFYSAMILKYERLVGVEYAFPTGENDREKELEEVKRGLRKKKLLRENSKGEITIDFALSACAAFCARPEFCRVIDEPSYHATIYGAAKAFLLLERVGEDENDALIFISEEELSGFIKQRLKNLPESENAEVTANGGA